MSRFARTRRVFFLEEPLFEDAQPHLRSMVCPKTGVNVVTPILPQGLTQHQITHFQKAFLKSLLDDNAVTDYVAWYYTPMALEFSSDLRPDITVYDCMDELSAFAGAPPAMQNNEAMLFQKADLVFTGGASLYESKRKQHTSVHRFPSSVEVEHFAQARSVNREPDDQANVPRPRLGYAGVIDERMDLQLIREIASARPDWHIVMLGPVVKINPELLPQAENIHYLGMKPYAELPAYFSGWDIGMLPFALNDSTRFISPTKTPEYLAAGLQVISAPIRDVITPYGDLGLAKIAEGANEFLRAADSLLDSPPSKDFQARVDQFLSQSSWDKTWSDMNQLIENKLAFKRFPSGSRPQVTPLTNVAAKGVANV
jgi:UDP-galactopyranose mutase